MKNLILLLCSFLVLWSSKAVRYKMVEKTNAFSEGIGMEYKKSSLPATKEVWTKVLAVLSKYSHTRMQDRQHLAVSTLSS